MKRILTIITASLMISGFAFAQDPATPNAGFENWTQIGSRYDPDNWNNLNPSTAILGVYTCTRASGVDKHTGNYAIKLQTKTVFFQTANGVATTGHLITTAPYGVTGGLPFTGRPDSISGWFKYTPASADSGFIQFQLKHNGDTVGFVRFQTGNYTTATYTRFSAPITYFSSATPDTSLWLLSSSRAANPIVNSALYVDDLQLVYNPPPCNTPAGLTTTNITGTTAKLNWAAVTGALQYKIRYRVKGTTVWTNTSSNVLFKNLTGLALNTQYQWQVRTKCSSVPLIYSLWTLTKTFKTLAVRSADDWDNNLNLLTVYPNPASNKITLSFETVNNEVATLSIINTLGQTVLNKTVTVNDGVYNEDLDVSSYAKGIYSLRIKTETESSTLRLLIQ
ncbi:MAG: T9SS type A sorting domain-containing protein [Bacteroidia bacterium]